MTLSGIILFIVFLVAQVGGITIICYVVYFLIYGFSNLIYLHKHWRFLIQVMHNEKSCLYTCQIPNEKGAHRLEVDH